ncbi:MAG: hypothetical protein KDA63_02760 [Planctomycetales bacterium]|nr:hypothetical protein [Planctomycetales bacterium]
MNCTLAAQQAALATEIAFAVEAKRQDALEAQGDAAVSLIKAAANVGKSTGAGEVFDAQA